MDRNIKFGQLLAIAKILGERVFEKGKPAISERDWKKYDKKPMEVFTKIHSDLMDYATSFKEEEIALLDLFGEILSEMNEGEFTNEPLNRTYLLGYYQQGNTLNNVIGVNEAAELTGLTPGTIKNYCADGRISAKKIGQSWVIDKIKLLEWMET